MIMLIIENYYNSNVITFLLRDIQYNNQFHVEWQGGSKYHHQSYDEYTIWDGNSRSEDMVERMFITWIYWLRWLAWWSIIKKIWLWRLFGINTILIVSKTSIGNAAATRRLIIFVGITGSCSSIWISLWMHFWKSIKIISTKSTGRAFTVFKVVIWSIIYSSEIRPWSYTQIL